jgi:hypothetical protein
VSHRPFITVVAGLLFVLPLVVERPAFATQLSAEDCRAKTRPCVCSDGPFMEVFLKNQQNSRDAWKQVYDTIGTASGPKTGTKAKEAHDKIFPGDPRVVTQYKTCPSYDKNADLSQFAGAPGPGELWVDQCACEAFCSDIIEATIAHESSHPTTIIVGAASFSIDMVMCAAGVEAQSLCDQIEPTILAASELIAYTIGNHSLDSAISKLAESPDPANPTIACTWQPIAAITPPSNVTVPKSLFARLVNLADRFWNGIAG